MAPSTCSKVILYMHSKRMIPVSISECAQRVSWEGLTMCIHRQTLENHHTQLSPSTSTQHTWNLFQQAYFCDAGLWIDRAWGHNFDGYFGSSAERQRWLYSALHSTNVFKGNPSSIWIGSIQAHTKIQVCGFWNPHSPICQPSGMLNVCLLQKTSTSMETPNMSQAQEAMLESYGL